MDFNQRGISPFPKDFDEICYWFIQCWVYTTRLLIYHDIPPKKQKLPVQRSVFFPFTPPCAEFQAPPPFNSAHGCLKFACDKPIGGPVSSSTWIVIKKSLEDSPVVKVITDMTSYSPWIGFVKNLQ
jgi:hypothetical protein